MAIYLNDHLMDFDLEDALTKLSEQRREQALRFKHEIGQRTCAAAYLLLCEALAKEYGIMWKPVFEYGEHGKPSIAGRPDIHFNLSHCREAALCGVSNQPIGVDVESVKQAKDSLVNYTMNEDEAALIHQSDNPGLVFTQLWTMKESVMKLTGQGINNQLKDVLKRNDVTWKTVVSDDCRYVYSICQFTECP